MSKRSITDDEISLIKAMIRRGMKNHEIQFFFNRTDRHVNSGRISGIRSGSYSNSIEILPADDNRLEEFLAEFQSTGISASVNVPAMPSYGNDNPIDHARLMRMFEKDKSGKWRFKIGESDSHECKEAFGFRYSDKWLRAVAALANNNGGYVFFGVKDKKVYNGGLSEDSYQVQGLNSPEFVNADPVDFTRKIRSTFDPTPRVENTVLNLSDLKVGVLYVHQHSGRPVIALKNEGDKVKEGDIFFRYSGESARIKYSDLRAILDERDRQSREQILPMVAKLLSIGPKDAMIADLASGVLTDEKRPILIGEDLLDRIKFIRQGEFKSEGDPTLRLVGDVHKIESHGSVVRKAFVTPADLVQEFLDLRTPHDPREYLRCAVEGGNGKWLPIFYYMHHAKMSKEELVVFINNTNGSVNRKKTYSDRAAGKIRAFRAAGGRSKEYLQKIGAGEIPNPSNATDAAHVAHAIMGLESKPEGTIDELLGLLATCKEIIQNSKKSGQMSAARRAIARLDELYFS